MRQYDLTVLVSVADGEEAAKGIETKIYKTVTNKKDYTLRHFKKDLLSL